MPLSWNGVMYCLMLLDQLWIGIRNGLRLMCARLLDVLLAVDRIHERRVKMLRIVLRHDRLTGVVGGRGAVRECETNMLLTAPFTCLRGDAPVSRHGEFFLRSTQTSLLA